jgi:hypothetical protein
LVGDAYSAATTSTPGITTLSDTYNAVLSGQGIAASQKAVADVYSAFNTTTEASLIDVGWLESITGNVTKRAEIATLSVVLERSTFYIPVSLPIAVLPVGYVPLHDMLLPVIALSASKGLVVAYVHINSSDRSIALDHASSQNDLQLLYITVTYVT